MVHRPSLQTPPGEAERLHLDGLFSLADSPTALPLAQRFFSALFSVLKGDPHG